MSERWVAIMVLVATLSACSVGAPRPVSIGPNITVERIAPDVWIHTTWRTLRSGQRFRSNGLVLVQASGVLLIDTAWGERPTRSLLDWIQTTFEKPVTAAVATHFHADRIGGAGVLEEGGTPLYVSPRTLNLATEVTAPLQALTPSIAPGDSVEWFDQVVFYPGPGHSHDNLVVYSPDTGILFGGCLILAADATGLGNLRDADVDEWPTSLRRLQSAIPDARVLVPSHGLPGSPAELIGNTKALLEAHR